MLLSVLNIDRQHQFSWSAILRKPPLLSNLTLPIFTSIIPCRLIYKFDFRPPSLGTEYGMDPVRELMSPHLLLYRFIRATRLVIQLETFERTGVWFRKSLKICHRGVQGSKVQMAESRPLLVPEFLENFCRWVNSQKRGRIITVGKENKIYTAATP